MASAKAAGATLLFVGGGGSAGYGINEMLKMEPDATLLSSLGNNLSTKYSTDKFGNTDNNKDLFVDPDDNQSWWEWVYKRRFSVEEAKSSEFQAVTAAYSGSNNSSLNRVCRKALTVKKVELVKVPYKKDIWRYCSKFGKLPEGVVSRPVPKTLDNKVNTKFAQIEANKTKFADPSQQDNEEFWNWVYENRLRLVKEDSSRKDKELHDTFKSVSKGYHSSESGALNQVCKTVGEKKPVEVTNIKLKKNAWKYCSKIGKIPEDVEAMPTAYPLSDNRSKSHTISGNDKLGSLADNKSRLISNISGNEEWWNWVYENRLGEHKLDKDKKSNIHSTFSSATKGYSNNSPTDDSSALNLICKTAYTKEEQDLKDTNYQKSIATYCTKDEEKLLTIPPTKSKTA